MDRQKRKSTRNETLLGLSLMMILVIIGGGIWVKQFDFSPALLNAAKVTPKPLVQQNLLKPESILSQMMLPVTLKPLSPVETFGPSTLSDKINGKAELYLSAGFKTLEAQRFELDGRKKRWLEMFVYDMDTTKNAFSVFSVQRREGAAAGNLGDHSYQTENALYVTYGPFYLEIIASSDNPDDMTAVGAIADAFIKSVKVESNSIGDETFFPKIGLSKDTITLIASDAFGFEQLDQVYTAQYRLGDADLTAFVSRRNSPQEARNLFSAYHAFLLQFGGEEIKASLDLKNLKVVSILDSYEVIFSKGSFLAGVHQAEDVEHALKLAEMLDEKLKENTSDH